MAFGQVAASVEILTSGGQDIERFSSSAKTRPNYLMRMSNEMEGLKGTNNWEG